MCFQTILLCNYKLNIQICPVTFFGKYLQQLPRRKTTNIIMKYVWELFENGIGMEPITVI